MKLIDARAYAAVVLSNDIEPEDINFNVNRCFSILSESMMIEDQQAAEDMFNKYHNIIMNYDENGRYVGRDP